MIDEPERYELSEPRRYTFELERRAFLRLFGGGLAVLVAATDSARPAGNRTRAGAQHAVAGDRRVDPRR